jgi:hypothetical protein
MSDSSSSETSGSFFRVTKKNTKKNTKKANTKSAKSAKSTKSTKSAAKPAAKVTKKNANAALRHKKMLKSLKKHGIVPKTSAEMRKAVKKSRKLYKKKYGHSYENSPNSLDPAGLTKKDQKVLEQKILDRAYRRFGRKVGSLNETGKPRGIEMNDKAKRIVKKFVEEKSYSFGSGNERELVERLGAYNVARAIGVRAPEIKERMKKEADEAAKRVKEEKEEAAKGYKQRKENIKAAEERLKELIAAAKKAVKREFKALYKGTNKEVSDKDVDQVARLVGQGFAISAADHLHLKKHIMDERFLNIVEDLMNQADAEGVDHCAACDVTNYIKHI